MHRTPAVLATALLVALPALAAPPADAAPAPAPQAAPAAAPQAAAAPAAAATVEKHPLSTLPYTPSLSVASMDRSVDPCVDFYRYSCGGWLANNPIPPDQAAWSVYGKLSDELQQYLWGVLDEAAKGGAERTANQQKIGDAFASCMDTGAIESAGTAPVAADLAAIDAIGSVGDLPPLLARLHLAGGGNLLFGFGSRQDAKDTERVIGIAYAGGLGLPDRDYYLKDDARSAEIRSRYLAHVAQMLTLLGEEPDAAKAKADRIFAFEKALATASLTRVERRDPDKTYHKMTVAELQKLTPGFAWQPYLAALGVPAGVDVDVTQPAFFQELGTRLAATPIADLRDYLRWQLVNGRASQLPSRFDDADFDFYGRFLRGVEQQPPRWKRCVRWVDNNLGEALGEVFVQKTFGPEVKASTVDMVQRIETAMGRRIEALPWMNPATKKEALAKLHGMRNKIGYPEVWRDYSSLAIRRGDFAGNSIRANEFEARRQLAKIGRPVDRGEWDMTPPTVNAYYNPLMNDMNFPAGVLLPPLFDLKMDAAPNYGNTGGTVGHELVHGFDDEGRKFDAHGNLRDWWTAEDAKEFEKRVSCVADQYATYTVVDDIKINSRLTLGEDVADLGGLILAYEAWKDATRDQQLESRDGLTPDQRFFVGFAQWACSSVRPETLRMSALTNPHSPGVWRINGVVVNMPEFAQAFSCKAGQPMVNANVCRIW